MSPKLVWFLVFTCFISKLVAQKCSLHIRKDLPENSPVFIGGNKTLLAPTDSILTLDNDQIVTILCSGRKNSFANLKNNENSLKCSQGNLELNAHKIENFTEIRCKDINVAEVVDTGRRCSNGGKLKDIGFKTNAFGFVKYIGVCYSDNKAGVIYTHHFISGKGIKGRIHSKFRPLFNPVGVPRVASATNSYRRVTQLKRFTTLLKSKNLAENYINNGSYLSRGHLSPNADGVFRSWQLATFFYINVAPQWQIVNEENWEKVERMTREKAGKLEDNLEVYTGVAGVLTLFDAHGTEVPLYLHEKGNENYLPIPKWYWKIIKYKDEGIAFITLNNPFAKTKELICPDVCQAHKWQNREFSDLTKGFTYCCKISDLMKSLSEIPPEANARSIMSY